MEDTAFYCLVVGTRAFEDYNLFCSVMDQLLCNQKNIIIVSGGASGADKLAEKYAVEHDYQCKVFPADWNTYGKRAGYIRNEQMHKFIAEKDRRGVVAFWDGKSKGTAHSFELAKKYNNPIKIYNYINKKYLKQSA